MTENQRNYTFGINVESAQELESISVKVRDFMRTIGEGDYEIQVAINPALGESSGTHEEQGYAEGAPAIGFVYDGEGEVECEEEDE